MLPWMRYGILLFAGTVAGVVWALFTSVHEPQTKKIKRSMVAAITITLLIWVVVIWVTIEFAGS